MSARKLIWVIVVIGVLGIIFGCGNLQKLSEKAREKAVEEEQMEGEAKPAPQPAQPQQQPSQPAIQVTETPPAGPLAQEAQKVLVQKTEEFVYDPINKKDPFEPFKPQVAVEQQTQGELLQAEYMGRYELRSLKLVAIAWGLIEPRAMFETPDGKSYSVKTGDIFSKDAAEVLSITPEGVLIQVASKAITGEVVTQKIMIKLKPEEQAREESESFLGFGVGTKRPEGN